MVKKHLARLAAPKSWPIERKKTKWVTRPNPSPHKLHDCIPLNLVIKELLNHAKTTREVKKILNKNKILVNKIARKNPKFPLGIMDVLEIPETNEYYRLFYNKKGKFILHKITKEEANLKPAKIIKKTILKKGKIQINFNDGRNLLVDKNDYKTNDVLLFELPNKIKAHLKFEKGALILLTKGKHIGSVGILENIQKFQSSKQNKITFRIDKKLFETSENYAFVIGKEKPIISLPEK